MRGIGGGCRKGRVINHSRIFTSLPAKGLITDIECEARDKDQLDALVASLRAKGYEVDQVELG